MRKKSGSNFQELNFKEFGILTRNEKDQYAGYFKKTEQRNGGICFYDFVNILRNCGYDVNEARKQKLNRDIVQKELKVLDLNALYWAAAILKKQKEEASNPHESQDNEYLDAFVALGGNIDTSGFVTKAKLIQTLKYQFELVFDIEVLLQGLDNVENDKLQFKQFCELFQQDKKSFGRKSSVISLLSNKSLQNSDSMKSLVINQKDFEKYLARIEGHELNSP